MNEPREVRERQDLMRRLAGLVAGLFLVWAGGLLAFIEALPREVADPHGTADGIAVLTGGSDRLGVALQLLSEHKGRRLLISGVNAKVDREVLRRAVGGPDSFDCCVDLGREARDTRGNAREIARWAAAHGFASLRIVTAGYHMPRSLLEIERADGALELIPHPVFPSKVRLDGWWGWPGTATLIISEYGKYLVALIALRLAALSGGGETVGGAPPG